MRTAFRSLTLGLAALSAAAVMAQTNTIDLSITVVDCTVGDTIHVTVSSDNGLPPIDLDVMLDSNCTYTGSISGQGNSCLIYAELMCTGPMSTAIDTVNFTGGGETTAVAMTLACGGAPDCLGIPDGPNVPGTSCDDGYPATSGDTWSPDCVCSGIICNPPVITGTTPPPTVCSYDSLTLEVTASGTGPLSYNWSGPGWFAPDSTSQTVSVYGSIGGNYHVTVSNACGTDTADVPVTVVTAPNAGINAEISICDITSPISMISLLSGTPDPGGTWTYNGTTHAADFDPAMDTTGTYIYHVVGMAPCGDATSWLFIDLAPIWYGDADSDGYGDPNVPTQSCTQPVGYVANDSDNCPILPGIIGSSCDDGDPNTTNDSLNANCACVGTPASNDCLGIPNGPNQPGTSCTDSLGNAGTWSTTCICVVTPSCQACFTTMQAAPFIAIFSSCSTGGMAPFNYSWDFSDAGAESGNPITHQYPGPGTYTVCLNIVDANGNWCNTCDSVVVGPDGTINPSTPTPCHANFWTVQAYDSTDTGGVEPILNEVWVWNLSTGGNGSYQFLWNFGDGSTSTDPFPTHVYDGLGPWGLCLTIHSGGCTDTYCDSVSVDQNGILNGMVIDGHPADQDQRTNGFTLNVLQPTPAGIEEVPAFADLRLWPNPAQTELNLSFNNTLYGAVSVKVIDPTGRLVIGEEHNLALGRNTLRLNTAVLQPGLYVVRIGNDAHSLTHRFMKVN